MDFPGAGKNLPADLCARGPAFSLNLPRVIGACRHQKLAFFEFSRGWRALKPTSEKAGIGLRRENVRFLESKKLKP